MYSLRETSRTFCCSRSTMMLARCCSERPNLSNRQTTNAPPLATASNAWRKPGRSNRAPEIPLSKKTILHP